MQKNLKNYISEHIKNLGVKKNDRLLVYSDLSKFGIDNKNLPQIMISSLKNIVGIKGTIVMPFYILDMKQKYVFDKKKFIFSKKIGSLTRKFCKEKNLFRSNSTIHNHIGIGPDAKILNFSKDKISLGKGSDFENMYRKNFKLLLLGCDPMQGATYLHHIEALQRVPYRKWITVKKMKKEGKKIINISVKYFAKKDDRYISNFDLIFNDINRLKNNLIVEKIKYGKSFCINLQNLHKFSIRMLKKDIFYFVKKNS